MAPPQLCAGCGEKPGDFQCPLCQAAELDGGFFCSQQCFAKCFVAHRDATHKSGVVRAKRSTADKVREQEEETRKRRVAKKRALAADVPTSAQDADRDAEDIAAMPHEEAFSDEEEEAAYQAALQKELAKRKELPLWGVWPGVDVTGDATEFVTAAQAVSPASAKKAATSIGSSRAVLRVTPGGDGNGAWARSDVAIASDDIPAHLHAAALFAVQSAMNWNQFHHAANGEHSHAVIVCGSATSAHAAGFAARCRGVPCAIVAGTDETARTSAPELLLNDLHDTAARRIVIVSYPALTGESVELARGRVSQWLAAGPPQSKALLIALPDLPVDPEELQSLTAPSLFVRKPSDVPAASPSPSTATAKGRSKSTPAKSQSASVSSAVATIPALEGAAPLVAADFEPSGARYDVGLSYALVVRGDLQGFVDGLARLYSLSKAKAEDYLVAALLADWGQRSAAHAHHKLATLLRLLVDASVKMSTMAHVKDQQSLAYIAARCVVRAVKHLPHLTKDDAAAAGSPCPFIYLDATLAYCLSKIPKSIADELAESWGLHELGVVSSVGHEDRLRQVALHRLRALYQPKLGVTPSTFAGILHHCVADASLRHALTVKDVRAATMWGFACGRYGALSEFLVASQLVHRPEELTSASGHTREGKKTSRTQRNKTSQDDAFVTEATQVRQHPTQTCKKLRRLQWPLLGARRRRRELMRRSALDELLSAMPSSSNVPMYLGDVGNLIGKWTTFNNRFGGYLPTSLVQFIEEHPEEFRLVGNLVTRVKDSKTAQIKLRFDADEGPDSDDERRKKKNRAEGNGAKKKISLADIRTRRGLQTAEKRLMESKNMTKRAAKKRMKQLRNKARYNRNTKKMDASARVPGYSKPKAKEIKGRGKKANARTWKRS